MKRSQLLKLALAAGATGAAAAAAGVVVAGRRWAAADDPDAVARLQVPEGSEVRIPTADGGEISATVVGDDGEGDSRTFVLVHGWVNDRRIWSPVARILAERGHRVVLYDQRGHGSSRAGDDGLTIEAIGADMAAVLEHLDAKAAIVAGHSMGGMAAQAFAVHHPEVLANRVAAVALVSTACSDIGAVGPTAKLAPYVLGSSLINRFISHAHFGPVLMRGTLGKRATISNLRVMQDTFVGTEPAARTAFYRAMEAMDLREGLADVDVPVVVVSGTRDTLVFHSNSRRLAQVIKGARFEAVHDAGHMLPLETPETVADLLEELAQTSAQRDAAVAS